MQLIETKTLGADAASIEFTSIPQTYTDLVVLISARRTTADIGGLIQMDINGVSTDRTHLRLEGTGSAVASGTGTSATIGVLNGGSSTANTFGNTCVYLPNYSGNSAKTVSIDTVNEQNATAADQRLYAVRWNSTAAITSLTFYPNSGNFVAGSTISLYGILKGSDGITTAT